MVQEQDKDEKLKLQRTKRSTHQKINFYLEKNNVYASEIKINKKKQNPGNPFYKYTIYEHTTTRIYPSQNVTVSYGSEPFKIVDNNLIDPGQKFQVQQKTYERIETYSYDRLQDVHLLVKFTISEFEYDFFKRVDRSGVYWKQIEIDQAVHLKKFGVSEELSKIEYEINKSIKIELDKRSEYFVNLVENSSISSSYESPVGGNDLKIRVTEKKDCINGGGYKCYLHDLTLCSSRDVLSEVAGLRLYDDTQEIKLYKNDTASEKDRKYLYYLPGARTTNNLTFYFKDNDLLLCCYSKMSFKPKSKEEYCKLVHYRHLGSCECRSENLDSLKRILDLIKEELYKETRAVQAPEITSPHSGSESQRMPSNGHPQPKQEDPKSGFWEENKIYIFSGGGGALGAVSLIGLGVLIYKKCVKVTAAVAIDPVL